MNATKTRKPISTLIVGFVDEILLHIPDAAIKIIYCKIRASRKISNFKELWVVIQDNGKILTFLCTWASQCCNYIIACLYKTKQNMQIRMETLIPPTLLVLVLGIKAQKKE